MAGYNLLDTRAFDAFISQKNSLINNYNDINNRYSTIVDNLLLCWKGLGADAFDEDARVIKTNIVGIQDILNTMCDTLIDCRDIFGQCDSSLGNANRNAMNNVNK